MIRLFFIVIFTNAVSIMSYAQPNNIQKEYIDSSYIYQIYHERFKLLDLFDGCVIEGTGKPCAGDMIAFIKDNLDKQYIDWLKQSSHIEKIFVNSINSLHKVKKNNSTIINENVYVKIIAYFLSHDIHSDNNAFRLLRMTSFDLLKENGEIIIYNVKNSRLDDETKSKLLVLAGATETEIKSIVRDKFELPLSVKARLGNIDAEKELIDRYSKIKDYREKTSLLWELMIAGTQQTIRHVVENFNEPIFSVTGTGCISKSIRHDILSALRVYYPAEELLGNKLSEIERSRNSEKLKKYLDEVENWLKNTFNVNLIHERPGLTLMGLCKK